jgi:hypothetical protein
VKRINPNIDYSFLLIDTLDSVEPLYSTDSVDYTPYHHSYFYQKDVNDDYMRYHTVIYEQYKNMLKEIGYNVDDTNTEQFDDRSEV